MNTIRSGARNLNGVGKGGIPVKHRGRLAKRRVVVTGVATLVVLLGAASPGAAAPSSTGKPQPGGAPSWVSARATNVPGGFGTWAELFAFQHRLNAAADKISVVDPGNASIVADPASRELRVHWHGAIPSRAREVAEASGVPVTFAKAAYRHDDLVAEARRLAADPRSAGVHPSSDGTGLEVKVTTRRLNAGQRDLLGTSRIPLRVTVSQRPTATFGRTNDTPPFWGGSRYNGVFPTGYSYCTNGFGIAFPGQPNRYMITAAHCGVNNGPVWIPGQPYPTGTMGFRPVCRDTALINYPSGTAGAIYTGPWNSVSSVAVGGAAADYVGNVVNTGGASSGENPGLVVRAIDHFTPISGSPCTGSVGPLNYAENPAAGGCAVYPGDSGGPVYYYSGGKAIGVGTISAGLNFAGCAPVDPEVCPSGPCVGYNRVYYAPLLRAVGGIQGGSLNYYGVGILTL